MKNIRSLLYTTLCLFILTLLVSFILSILYTFNCFVPLLAHISEISGYLIFMISGFLLGKNIKEKTFLFALFFSFIGFVLCFSFTNKELIHLVLLIGKWILFIIFALIAKNIKKRN